MITHLIQRLADFHFTLSELHGNLGIGLTVAAKHLEMPPAPHPLLAGER